LPQVGSRASTAIRKREIAITLPIPGRPWWRGKEFITQRNILRTFHCPYCGRDWTGIPHSNIDSSVVQSSSGWLNGYYFARSAVAAVWVIAAFTIAKGWLPLPAMPLIAYPAWDIVANRLWRLGRSGGRMSACSGGSPTEDLWRAMGDDPG
jgi:hypothetical protein